MKKLFLLLTVTVVALGMMAQDRGDYDVIYRSSKDSIIAKVLTVNKKGVTYQKWSNIEGPTYSMPVSEIAAIRYANGTYETFDGQPYQHTEVVRPEERYVNVQFANGRIMEGLLISYDEDLLVIEPNTVVKYEKRIKPIEVMYFDMEGVGRYNSVNGKFVLDETTRIIPTPQPQVAEVSRARTAPIVNPTEVIGNAFKVCGGVALGIGVPALAVGTILTAVGRASNITPIDDMLRCQQAGYYLLPIGASLTVIGIPLYVHGKRIAELNFNFNGNGAGLAMNF